MATEQDQRGLYVRLSSAIDEAEATGPLTVEDLQRLALAAPALQHTFTGDGPGVQGADNCQVCGRWFDEPETALCRNTAPIRPCAAMNVGDEPQTEPLEKRLAKCLAAIVDEPILAGRDECGAFTSPLEIRLGFFLPELTAHACVLLEEAGE